MGLRDKHCLYQIKHQFGGSVKLRSGVNCLRYRLHHKEGMIRIIHAVNGEIRNPIRLLQLQKPLTFPAFPFLLINSRIKGRLGTSQAESFLLEFHQEERWV